MSKKIWKKYLLPIEDNDFSPQILRKAAVAGMTVLVLISFSVANLHSILWLASNWLVASVLPAVVAEETNLSRAQEELPPLVRSPLLDEAARLKAQDMADKGYFSHWSPNGTSPWYWFEMVDYSYLNAGENLAVHFTDSTAVVDAWLDSPSHRANIMNAKYTEIGIGTASGRFEGYDTVFVVQLFGTPAKAAVATIDRAPEELDPAEETFATLGVPAVAGVEETKETIDLTESGTMVVESFAATENAEAEVVSKGQKQASGFWRVLTSPRLVLQIVYSIIGLLVVLALLLAFILEWRRQRPAELAYSAALLAAMIVLFKLHIALSGSVIIA